VPDHSPHITPTRYVTADIPPLGGVLKQRPEDFLVDEQPQYQPCGEGEHIYMLVQKRGMSTMHMLGVLAEHFGVKRGNLGYAGLKDKHAITRQVISLHAPGRRIEDFPMLRHEQVAILWADYHTNKLRPGHLRGNRFSIRIRNVDPMRVRDALRVLQRLQKIGVPNRIGEQRFGMLANNHIIGRCIIAGEYDGAVRALLGRNAYRPEFNAEARELFERGQFAEAIHHYPMQATIETRVLRSLADGKDARRAMQGLDETSIRFYLSAFQSAVFNAVLDRRLADGDAPGEGLGALREGDVAIKHQNGAVFGVDASTLAEPGLAERLATFDISPSGPMWGSSMLRGGAGSATDACEVECLANAGVSLEQLAAFDKACPWPLEGKRRPLRVPLIDPEVEGGIDEHGTYVRCAFELPRGSFATVAMREVMKNESVESDDEPHP
jgi:tRNA pseudouridine13 synthase